MSRKVIVFDQEPSGEQSQAQGSSEAVLRNWSKMCLRSSSGSLSVKGRREEKETEMSVMLEGSAE